MVKLFLLLCARQNMFLAPELPLTLKYWLEMLSLGTGINLIFRPQNRNHLKNWNWYQFSSDPNLYHATYKSSFLRNI